MLALERGSGGVAVALDGQATGGGQQRVAGGRVVVRAGGLHEAGGRVRVIWEAQGWARESGGGEARFEGVADIINAASSAEERRVRVSLDAVLGPETGSMGSLHHGLFGRTTPRLSRASTGFTLTIA